MKSYTRALRKYNKNNNRRGDVLKFTPEYYDVMRMKEEYEPKEREIEIRNNSYFPIEYIIKKIRSSSKNEIITFSEFKECVDKINNFEYELDYSKMLSEKQLKDIFEYSRKQHFIEMKKVYEMCDKDKQHLLDFDIVFDKSIYHYEAYDFDFFYQDYRNMFYGRMYIEQEWRINDFHKAKFNKLKVYDNNSYFDELVKGTDNPKDYYFELVFQKDNDPVRHHLNKHYMTLNVMNIAYNEIVKTERLNSRLKMIKQRRHIRKNILRKQY